MRRRATLLAGGVVAAACLGAAPAQGHHLVLISEVFPGLDGDEQAEFVELQMHEVNQERFGLGSSVEIFGADGGLTESVPLEDAALGESQRTLLLTTQQAESRFGVTGDEAFDDDELDPAGGAVCFNSTVFPSPIDCVAWGAIVAPPPSAGPPAGAIPDGASLERAITRRCSTWLEAADDTDSSAADFFPSFAPTPRPNAAIPTELVCPNTFFVGVVPNKRTRNRTARFRFNSSPEGATSTYYCKLDSGPYRSCSSPYVRRVRPGRHVLRVLAQGELSPARYRWRVLKR